MTEEFYDRDNTNWLVKSISAQYPTFIVNETVSSRRVGLLLKLNFDKRGTNGFKDWNLFNNPLE